MSFLTGFISRHKSPTFILLYILLALLIIFFSVVHYNQLTFSKIAEISEYDKLEATKQFYSISPFTSDGCSGNVSDLWSESIVTLSAASDDFAERYKNLTSIPFEFACIEHDERYYRGDGGYQARLAADTKLKSDILEYATNNKAEISARSGLKLDEVEQTYEILAETIFQGVRVGGAPCTAKSYAWGYGYNEGVCVE